LAKSVPFEALIAGVISSIGHFAAHSSIKVSSDYKLVTSMFIAVLGPMGSNKSGAVGFITTAFNEMEKMILTIDEDYKKRLNFSN